MTERKSDEQNVHNGSVTLKGALGDALHAVLCGAGHNIRLLLRRLQCRLRRFCAFILLSILACVRLMLPDRSEITL